MYAAFLSEVEVDVKTGKTKVLPDEIAYDLADEFRLPLPRQKITKNVDEAVDFARDTYPVIIKATTVDLVHKTDFKAIYLNIMDKSELVDR